MKITQDLKFKNGWFIGNFEPTILKTTDFEVSHQFHPIGFISVPHYHKVSNEYNYIVRGMILLNHKNVLKSGDTFIYEPNEISDVEFLEDTDMIVVRVPSAPGDKYEV